MKTGIDALREQFDRFTKTGLCSPVSPAQRDWRALDHRCYPIVRDCAHGLSLMQGAVRLRIDRERQRAALVGEVREVIESPGSVAVYISIWTPVPIAIARQMAQSLHKMDEHPIGDQCGGRIGWRDSGYDGEVADWYCHIQ